MTLTPATFPAALKAATSGSILQLGPGNYGNLVIYNRTFPDRLTIKAADPASPPVFNSGLLRGVDGLNLEGITFSFAPTMTTVENQNVVAIEGCSNVTLSACKITSGMAINGIAETDTKPDAFGTVNGWPLGRGVYIQLSRNVEVSGCEVWDVQRGLLTYKGIGIRFLGNYVHDVRRTFILGDACDLTIRGNRLWGSKPWRWGQTPIGDHGDFIALYPSSLGPMTKVSITNNVCEQRAGGTAILGITLASIRTLEVRGNLMRGTDHQGIVATDVIGAVISDNLLMGRAGILLRTGTERVVSSGNMAAYYEDRLKGASGNTLAGPRKLVSEMALPGPIRVVIVSP